MSFAWVRFDTRLVVDSRAACRLKLLGSERTEASSSPPRGTSRLPTVFVVRSDAVFERQPPATSSTSEATAAELAKRRGSLVKIWPRGQKTGRSKNIGTFVLEVGFCVQIRKPYDYFAPGRSGF